MAFGRRLEDVACGRMLKRVGRGLWPKATGQQLWGSLRLQLAAGLRPPHPVGADSHAEFYPIEVAAPSQCFVIHVCRQILSGQTVSSDNLRVFKRLSRMSRAGQILSLVSSKIHNAHLIYPATKTSWIMEHQNSPRPPSKVHAEMNHFTNDSRRTQENS